VALCFDNRSCDDTANLQLLMLGIFTLLALCLMMLVGYMVKRIPEIQHSPYDALSDITTRSQSSGDPLVSGPAVDKFRRDSYASWLIAMGDNPTVGVWVFGVSLSGYLMTEGDCVDNSYKLLSAILIPSCLFVVTSAQITFWIVFQDTILNSFTIPTSDGTIL